MKTNGQKTAKERLTLKQKIMAHTLNMPARSSIYFTATNLISKGASFIFTPMFTRLLTPAEYGEYSLFSSYLSMSIVIVTLEIPGSVIMRAFQKNRGLEHLSVITAYAIPLLLTPPTVALLYLMRGGPTFSFAYTFLILSLASIAFINMYISACKFLYRWRAPLFIALIQSILTPILSITLINAASLGAAGHVTVKIGTAAAISGIAALTLIISSVLAAVKEARSVNMDIRSYLGFAKELFATLFKLCIPLLPYYFSVMLISQIDKLTISRVLGSEALGKYSIAYSAGIALTAVTGGIMSALCPWIMRKVRAGEISAPRRAVSSIIGLALPAVTLFLSASPEIFAILAPKNYQIALPVLFITAITPIPLAVSGCLCSIAVAKERTWGILLSGVSAAALAVILELSLVRASPLFVPAIITTSSYLLLMILEAVCVKRILGESVINVNKAIQSILFLSFFAAIIFVLKSILLARIGTAALSALYLLYMLKRSKWLLAERNTE